MNVTRRKRICGTWTLPPAASELPLKSRHLQGRHKIPPGVPMKTSCRLILLSALSCCLIACGGGGGGGGVTTSTPPPTPAPLPPPPGPTAAELLDDSLQGLPLAEFYEVSFAALVVRDVGGHVTVRVGTPVLLLLKHDDSEAPTHGE